MQDNRLSRKVYVQSFPATHIKAIYCLISMSPPECNFYLLVVQNHRLRKGEPMQRVNYPIHFTLHKNNDKQKNNKDINWTVNLKENKDGTTIIRRTSKNEIMKLLGHYINVFHVYAKGVYSNNYLEFCPL